MESPASMESLMDRLQTYLDAHATRPWCVHELWDEVGSKFPGEDTLVETQRLLNHLARAGRIASSGEMVERGDGVCDDWFYWSAKSGKRYLDEFGARYQFPGLSDLIRSHCRHRV